MYFPQKKQQRDLSVVVLDEQVQETITPTAQLKVYTTVRHQVFQTHKNIFVVTPATQLERVAALVSEANRKNHLRALLIRADITAEFVPQLMDQAKLRSLRHTLIHQSPQIPKRILTAWSHGAEDQLIAHASVKQQTLYVLSCALDLVTVRFQDIPALTAITVGHRLDFVIPEDGRYLQWPHEDIHLDLDTIRYHTNPDYKETVDLRRLQYAQHIGQAIRAVREAHQLRQTDITGLSARHVRRIENGDIMLTADSIQKLAAAHQMQANDYVEHIARKQHELADAA